MRRIFTRGLGQANLGATQGVMVVSAQVAGCPYPYWIQVNSFTVINPNGSIAGSIAGDQTCCGGAPAGCGSACLSMNSPIVVTLNAQIYWDGTLVNPDNTVHPFASISVQMVIRDGPCAGGLNFYRPSPQTLPDTTGRGTFLLQVTADQTFMNGLKGLVTSPFVAYLNLLSVS